MKIFKRLFQSPLVALFAISVFLTASGCSKSNENTAKTIQAAVAPTVPPYLFEQNGQLVGVDLEIFKGYCESRGYAYKIKSYDFAGMLGAVASGQADIAFSGISITDQRKQVMDFSNPYAESTWNLVSLTKRNIRITDINQLKKYSIGFPTGTVFMGYVQNTLEPGGYYSVSKVKLYPSYSEALTDLNNGNLDLVFVDSSMLSTYINKLRLPVQSSYEIPYGDRLGFAFAKGSPMRDDFNKYLAELGPEKIKAYTEKWEK
jgi:polar amino acid transport system substrate-binding protein